MLNLASLQQERLMGFVNEQLNIQKKTKTSLWFSLLIQPFYHGGYLLIQNFNRCWISFKASSSLRRRNLKTHLPPTLIRHENGTFQTLFNAEESVENAGLRFSVDGKHFENRAFPAKTMISPEFSSNTNPKMTGVAGVDEKN